MREKPKADSNYSRFPGNLMSTWQYVLKIIGAGALKLYSQKSLERTLVATLIIFTVNE